MSWLFTIDYSLFAYMFKILFIEIIYYFKNRTLFLELFFYMEEDLNRVLSEKFLLTHQMYEQTLIRIAQFTIILEISCSLINIEKH